jgi:hypothetical protein
MKMRLRTFFDALRSAVVGLKSLFRHRVLLPFIFPRGPMRIGWLANGPSVTQPPPVEDLESSFLPFPPNPETGSKMGDFKNDLPPSGVSRNQFQSVVGQQLDCQ